VGFDARSSPSSRTRAKGSFRSLTEPRMIRSARSRTRPASGPYSNTTGRAASGFAANASASELLIATMIELYRLCGGRGRISGSGPGNKIGRQSGPDVLGDHPRRAVLGVAAAARTGETLFLSRVVVGHAREGLAGYNHFPAGDFGQR